MNSKNENFIGFELVDNDKLWYSLDTKLRRIGYYLGELKPIECLASVYDIPILPLSKKGLTLILRLKQDWEQQWNEADLLNAENLSVKYEIVDFEIFQKYNRSCYDIWIEHIVNAVKNIDPK